MCPPGNSRRTIWLDLVRSKQSPVLEMGVASAAELDELDAAALGAVAAEQAASSMPASVVSAHTAGKIISVVVVEAADRSSDVAVALAVVSDALRRPAVSPSR